MGDPFVTLIFRGVRYGSAAMPVEALPELAAYQDLVLNAARDVYFGNNPGRVRMPAGFEQSFRLVMTGVGMGSTVPEISRVSGPAAGKFIPSIHQLGLFGDEPDLFDRARDAIEDTIAAVASGMDLPTVLSKSTLARFNAFGRSMSDEDEIVVAKPMMREGARYNRAVRKRLVLAAQSTYEEEVTILGLFRGADLDSNGFVLRTPDHARIPVTCPALFLPVAMTSFSEAVEVRVRGIGVLNEVGVLQRITSALDVRLADEVEGGPSACRIPLNEQVEALRSLPNGWYDADSKAYEAEALEWLRVLLASMVDAFELVTPFIYPTPEGDARAEWPSRSWDVVVVFGLASKTAEALAVSTSDHTTNEIEVAFADAGGESQLGAFISEHLRKK